MPSQLRTPLHLTLVALVGLAGLALAACGKDDDKPAATSTTSTTSVGDTSTTQLAPPPGEQTDCGVAEGGSVTLVAKDLAWDVPCLQAPEGIPLTIVVKNEDDGVNHDLRFTGIPGEPSTPLEAGPITQKLKLGGDLKPGTYDYVCDIHPNMTGTLEVLAPLAEGPTTTQ